MSNLFFIIQGVFGYIIAGYIIRKINFLPNFFLKIFDFLSFNILLPLALVVNFWTIQFPEITIYNLLISFFGSGIIIFLIGFFISKKIYKFKNDDGALFGLGACFGNSVALGIPLMYSILGPIHVMPYMILVLFHGIVHFTYTTLIIENYRNRKNSNIKKILKSLVGLAQNIVLFGMLVGFFLNYTNIPFPVLFQKTLLPISDIALSTVLISLGMTLADFKFIKDINQTILLTSLKNIIHPFIAFIISKYIFVMSPSLIFIVTIAAALPSGSQTYYFCYRYNSLQNIISTNIVVSTFISFFTLSALLIIFGYPK